MVRHIYNSWRSDHLPHHVRLTITPPIAVFEVDTTIERPPGVHPPTHDPNSDISPSTHSPRSTIIPEPYPEWAPQEISGLCISLWLKFAFPKFTSAGTSHHSRINVSSVYEVE
ncbi:hypothetical protein EYC80_001226 [Monilinia laxa]|uniref:Uncharacterized protein n=1 Tax=Monilinia laxa TaxID=61186 RepID=A0A5N6K8S3_MONLA|nr:hypothetical protein EYC80_001226 [Monilinia laxa]